MQSKAIQQYGDELYEALRARKMLTPLTDRDPTVSIEDAYRISQRLLERRVRDGERLIGKKIGVTSKVVMDMLNVHQPDFGFLTDGMLLASGRWTSGGAAWSAAPATIRTAGLAARA